MIIGRRTAFFAASLTILAAVHMIYAASVLYADNLNTNISAWDNAVKLYGDSKHLRPHAVSIYSQTWNSRGALEKTEEQKYSLSYGPDGEPERTLISAVEDGKDITGKKRKEQEKDSGRGGRPSGENNGMDKSPLDPEVQGDITAFDTGKTEYLRNARCSVWNFNLKLNDKYNAEGKAWLSLHSGEAVSLEYRLVPSFPLVEEMNIRLNFTSDEKLGCLLDELQFDGKVNMLLMKKSFTSVTRFSEYR